MDTTGLKAITGQTWPGISDIWLTAQIIFQDVYRWGRYKETKIRKQNDLQHHYSIIILGLIFLEKIAPYHPKLNKNMIITCLSLHDHGEGELKRDIPWGIKTEIDDIDEYLAFAKRYGQLDKKTFAEFERAYLLQYALKDGAGFPLQAQMIIKELHQTNYQEALCFMAIENWDYVLYALEQYQGNRNQKILEAVTRAQLPILNDLVIKLAGLGETIWTPEIAAAFQKIIT